MAPTAAPAGIYDAALLRRQALMGSSGPAALVKNFRVFMIAMFACIGGLLYGEQAKFKSVTQCSIRRRLQSGSFLWGIDHACFSSSHGQLRFN